MNIQIILENTDIDYKEINNIYDATDRNHFSYKDSSGALNTIEISDDRIIIKRVDHDHSTKAVFEDHSYIEIENEQGKLSFSVKVLAFNRDFDNIVIAYCIEDVKIKYTIKYF